MPKTSPPSHRERTSHVLSDPARPLVAITTPRPSARPIAKRSISLCTTIARKLQCAHTLKYLPAKHTALVRRDPQRRSTSPDAKAPAIATTYLLTSSAARACARTRAPPSDTPLSPLSYSSAVRQAA